MRRACGQFRLRLGLRRRLTCGGFEKGDEYGITYKVHHCLFQRLEALLLLLPLLVSGISLERLGMLAPSLRRRSHVVRLACLSNVDAKSRQSFATRVTERAGTDYRCCSRISSRLLRMRCAGNFSTTFWWRSSAVGASHGRRPLYRVQSVCTEYFAVITTTSRYTSCAW